MPEYTDHHLTSCGKRCTPGDPRDLKACGCLCHVPGGQELVDKIMATPHTIAMTGREGLKPLVLTRPSVREFVARGKGPHLLARCLEWDPNGCPTCGQDIDRLGGNAECQVCAGEPAVAL